LRLAELAAMVYSVHPTLAYTSSEVLREGLYWLISFSAIAVFWSATQRNCWWQFLVGGILAVAATLSRVEGIMLFALAGMWWIASLWQSRRRLMVVAWKPAIAVMLLCLGVGTAAYTLVPAENWNKWQLVAMARDYRATHQSARADVSPLSGRQAWATMSPRRSLKHLADGLPAHQFRQERLIDLARDHLWPIYFTDLAHHVTKAFLFPMLIFLGIGLIWGSRRFWCNRRDWPLVLQSLMLVGVLVHHLATVHVISTRYAFALIPLVMPWSCLGFLQFYDWLKFKLAHTRWFDSVPQATFALVCLLVISAFGRSFHYLRDNKSTERQLGELVRETTGRPTVIVGPQKFRRVGFYADAEYAKMMDYPRGNPSKWVRKNAAWLKNQHAEYLLLDRDAMIATSPDGAIEPDPKLLQRMFADDARFHRMRIYRIVDQLEVAETPKQATSSR